MKIAPCFHDTPVYDINDKFKIKNKSTDVVLTTY